MSGGSDTKPPLMPMKPSDMVAALQMGFGTKKAKGRAITNMSKLLVRAGSASPKRGQPGYKY